ncbi:hypothetical protein Tcan_11110 [Toxocara canis]|uniref:Uncharacterized protein n=1 Tax=Toxocara canis TaxID=6265 RepID=A0A0B2VNY6_TOXCA|nr:hypothetical protein Tcan_11110 [Toxocara canis]
MRPILIVLLLCVFIIDANAIAKFEVISVSMNSVVIRMVKAINVSKFEMVVHIFDLDHRSPFRQTELSASRSDQLFSFDGLTPGTWFAIRILYRLFFADNSSKDLATKQELIVQTKNSSRYDQSIVNERIVTIDTMIVERSHMYIAVKSVFPNAEKISTLIVPELLCERGTIKPLAQQVLPVARFHFDLSTLMLKSKRSSSTFDPKCTRLCIFPFLRVVIGNTKFCRGCLIKRENSEFSIHRAAMFVALRGDLNCEVHWNRILKQRAADVGIFGVQP